MLIHNRRPLDKFAAKHAGSRTPLREWVEKVEAAQWAGLEDVKDTFNSADYVRGLVIFNIGGNNYRLVAEVVYKERIVRIAKIGTHAEYDGWQL
jgi:mRNA interferase HigB